MNVLTYDTIQIGNSLVLGTTAVPTNIVGKSDGKTGCIRGATALVLEIQKVSGSGLIKACDAMIETRAGSGFINSSGAGSVVAIKNGLVQWDNRGIDGTNGTDPANGILCMLWAVDGGAAALVPMWIDRFKAQLTATAAVTVHVYAHVIWGLGPANLTAWTTAFSS